MRKAATALPVPVPTGEAPAAPAAPRGAEAVAPFVDALRHHFPSRDELLAEARSQTRRRRTVRQAGVSALLAAVVAGVWWADPAWRSEDITTAVGEQAQWTMRDGSTLVLNTGSLLRVETRLRTRRFELERGEAAFHVAHGWRPFIVRAGDTTVRDIGTVFTVRRTGPGAEVTVLEGAVEVHAPGQAARTLAAGQALRAAGEAAAQPVRTVDAAAAGAWQQGRIVFDGTPLAEALAEIQRYRAAPLVLADARAGRLRLSGAYDVKAIESLIDALPQALPVTVARAPDGSVRVGAR